MDMTTMDNKVLREQLISELIAKKYELSSASKFDPGAYWEILPRTYKDAFGGSREELARYFEQYEDCPEKIEGFAPFLEERWYPDLPDHLRVTHR